MAKLKKKKNQRLSQKIKRVMGLMMTSLIIFPRLKTRRLISSIHLRTRVSTTKRRKPRRLLINNSNSYMRGTPNSEKFLRNQTSTLSGLRRSTKSLRHTCRAVVHRACKWKWRTTVVTSKRWMNRRLSSCLRAISRRLKCSL